MASRRETLRQIKKMLEAETGEKVHDDTAEYWLDGMCDAFVHKVEGAGYEYAVRESPMIAKYLQWVWLGDEGRKLREALDAYCAETGDTAAL